LSAEAMSTETDFPINAMLKWIWWFQALCFDHNKEIYSYLRKIYKEV
jgi:hypothetical protein